MKQAVVIAVALLCVGCAHTDVPVYVCQRTLGDIVIDGRLDEESWVKAESTGNFPVFDGKQESPLHTSAKMLWDDRALYVAFQCEDRDVYATYQSRDDPLWIQDVVEVYVMEQSLGRGQFLEYEISPLGTVFDYYVAAPFAGIAAWSSPGLRAAVAVKGSMNDPTDRDDGYTVEMMIPFVDFHLKPVLSEQWAAGGFWTPEGFAGVRADKRKASIPEDGGTIRLNLYRVDYSTPEKPGSVGERPGFMTWSPTIVRLFHVPERFGVVKFVRVLAGTPMAGTASGQ